MQVAYLSLTNDIPIQSRLFDTESAEEFEGDVTLPAMRKPGTAWEVGMYLTRDGAWVVNTLIIRKQDVVNVYKEVQGDEAREFLKKYHHLEAAERYFERPKGGRPKIGERLITTAPARVHNEIAELAEMYAEPMPDTIRRLLLEALEHRRIIGTPGSQRVTVAPAELYDELMADDAAPEVNENLQDAARRAKGLISHPGSPAGES